MEGPTAKTCVSAFFGARSSLMKSLMASAKSWMAPVPRPIPRMPSIVARRSASRPISLRSIQSMSTTMRSPMTSTSIATTAVIMTCSSEPYRSWSKVTMGPWKPRLSTSRNRPPTTQLTRPEMVE